MACPKPNFNPFGRSMSATRRIRGTADRHRPLPPLGIVARPPQTVPIKPGHCNIYKGSLHSNWSCCKSHDGTKITCNQLTLHWSKWHVLY